MKNNVNTRLLLTLFGAVFFYCFFYLLQPDLPGNNPTSPQGWWGWFDQGQYLKGALALHNLNFSPENHYYPPLFPFLGSLFISRLPMHPFFFVDGAAFLFFTYCFIKVSTRYVGFWLSTLLLAISVYFNPVIMSTFVIPWSTACTIGVISFAIVQLNNIVVTEKIKFSNILTRGVFISLAFGLLFLGRPVDALLAAVFFPSLILLTFYKLSGYSFKEKAYKCVTLSLVLLTGPVLSACVFALFNLKVFGSAFDGYFHSTAGSSGYFPFEIVKKTISLVSDSFTLYLEPHASIFSHYPWLTISVVGMIIALWRGDLLLRTLLAAIILHFSLYAPYGDLLPNGVWRYQNIHYFKWMFPYLAMFAWLAVKWAMGEKDAQWKNRVARFIAVAIIAVLVSSLSLASHKNNPESVRVQDWTLDTNVNNQPTDFIDVNGVSGGFTDVYFGAHQLWLDGVHLNVVKDYRILPYPDGVRILFNQTRTPGQVKIDFDHRLHAGEKVSVAAGSYSITLKLRKNSEG